MRAIILAILLLNAVAVKAEEWSAGTTVTHYELERCGANSYFAVEPISDAVFARMEGKSYKAGCTIPRSELRYIRALHITAEGEIKRGEMVVNRAISDQVLTILRKLFEAKYPIERMVLIDDYNGDDSKSMAANNTSSFNYRVIAGTDKLSRHAFGMAIDINPLYNPYVKGTFVSPESGASYVNRSKEFKYKISRKDLVYKILHDKFGFTWGGDWENCKDYQHFEK